MIRDDILSKGPRARRWILLAAVFGVPTLFLRTVNDPINVPKLSLLIVCVAVAAGIRAIELVQGAPAAGLRRLTIPAIAVIGPLLLAWLFSPYRAWSLFGEYGRFTGLVPYFVVVALAILVADAFIGQTRMVAWAITAAGIVAGSYALLQRFGLDPFEWSFAGGPAPNVVSSTLGNPDFVGGFLAIALPVAVALFFLEPERRVLSGAAVAIVAGGVLVSFSQGGWGAAAAGTTVTLSLLVAPRWRPARLVGLGIAGLIAMAGVGAVVAGMIAESPSGPTATRRADWWQAGIDMTRASPIVGRGPSSFAVEHSRYRTLDDALEANYNIENDPHNVLLSFSTGAGLIGAVGFLVFVWWGVKRGIGVADDDLLSAGFFGAFAAYVVQGLVSIDTVALRTTGWVTLAALVASTSTETVPAGGRPKKKQRQRAEPVRNVIVVSLVVISALLPAYWGVRFLMTDARSAHAESVLSQGDVTVGRDAYEAVLGFREELAYRRSYARQSGRLALVAAGAGEAELARSIYEVSAEAFAPIEDFPFATSLAERARFLRDWGGLDPETGLSDPARFDYDVDAKREALDLFERALRLDPRNLVLVSELAYIAFSLDEFEKAHGVLVARRSQLGAYELWGYLAFASARLGLEDEARAAIEAATATNPSDPFAIKAQKVIGSQN